MPLYASPRIEIPLHVQYDHQAIIDALKRKIGAKIVLLSIAKCESGYTQYNNDDTVLKGHVDNRDTGIFQINTYYHLDTSKKLGYDIYTVDGNIDYAIYLYDTYGTQPWSASKSCWSS